MKQSESVLQLTSPVGKLDVPEVLPHRQRTRYHGYNIGDSIGYINLTPWKSCWAQPFDQQKKMLGTKRREVGGKVDVQPPRERNGHDVEPVVYTAMPDKCYDELCDELAIQSSIDFDAADGLNALSHIEGQRQYTGVIWTTCHSNLLMDHLVDQVFFRMTSVENAASSTQPWLPSSAIPTQKRRPTRTSERMVIFPRAFPRSLERQRKFNLPMVILPMVIPLPATPTANLPLAFPRVTRSRIF